MSTWMQRDSRARDEADVRVALGAPFTATRPNTAWFTDITYIDTWQGWLYLAVVMDLFSRMIVGWPGHAHHSSRARAQCRPDGRASPTTARHLDSLRSGNAVRERRLATILPFEIALSRARAGRGTAGNNAVAESFFSSLKKERIKK
jgi:putative transposase